MTGHDGWVEHAVFSPDGGTIVTTSVDGTAIVWNATSGDEILTLAASAWAPADFSPDGTEILTGAVDGTSAPPSGEAI